MFEELDGEEAVAGEFFEQARERLGAADAEKLLATVRAGASEQQGEGDLVRGEEVVGGGRLERFAREEDGAGGSDAGDERETLRDLAAAGGLDGGGWVDDGGAGGGDDAGRAFEGFGGEVGVADGVDDELVRRERGSGLEELGGDEDAVEDAIAEVWVGAEVAAERRDEFEDGDGGLVAAVGGGDDGAAGEGFAAMPGGGFGVAEGGEGEGQAGVRGAVARVKFKRGEELLRSGGGLTALHEGVAEVGAAGEVLGADGDGALVEALGFEVAAGGEEEVAEVVQGFDVGWIEGEEMAIPRFGLGDSTSALEQAGLVEGGGDEPGRGDFGGLGGNGVRDGCLQHVALHGRVKHAMGRFGAGRVRDGLDEARFADGCDLFAVESVRAGKEGRFGKL
jgi:hypothetical protein